MTILTDHKPNTFLSSKPAVQLTRRQVHWQEFLSRFDFTWDYIKGRANVADPLSRHPAYLNSVCGALSAPGQVEIECIPGVKEKADELLDQIKSGYDMDDWFKQPRNLKPLRFENEVWLREGLVVIPDANDLRSKIMSLHHDTPFVGHFARDKTVQLIRQNYWWPSMTADVNEFVRTCV